jgi:peroxiredoxin
MAQFESLKDEIESAGLGAVFIAAEKREGMFHPDKFLREHPISFPFLLDEDRSVTKAYGLYHRIGLDAFNIAHPATFLIDTDQRVRFIYRGASQTDRIPLAAVLEVAKKSSMHDILGGQK